MWGPGQTIASSGHWFLPLVSGAWSQAGSSLQEEEEGSWRQDRRWQRG